MARTSTRDLPDETIELLRRHNVLKPLIKSELLEKTILPTPVNEQESARCLELFLKNNNLQEKDSLDKFLTEKKLIRKSFKKN